MKIFKRWQNSSRNGGIHWKSKKDISMVTRKKSKYSGTGSWIFLKMLQCHQLKVRTEGWKRMREIWGEKLWKGLLWMNLSGWSIKGLSGYVEYPFEIFSYKFEMNPIIRVFSLFFCQQCSDAVCDCNIALSSKTYLREEREWLNKISVYFIQFRYI